MAYNEQLADRVRERIAELADPEKMEEKKMMGGLCFMYDDKMLAGIMKDELMCRIDPEVFDHALEQNGCRIMELGSIRMQGYVLVDDTGMRTLKDLDYWLNLCLAFNPKAKSSKKKKK